MIKPREMQRTRSRQGWENLAGRLCQRKFLFFKQREMILVIGRYGGPLPATLHACDLHVVPPENTKDFTFLGTQHAGENNPITPIQFRRDINQQRAV